MRKHAPSTADLLHSDYKIPQLYAFPQHQALFTRRHFVAQFMKNNFKQNKDWTAQLGVPLVPEKIAHDFVHDLALLQPWQKITLLIRHQPIILRTTCLNN